MTLKLVLLSVLLVWNLVILSVYGLDKHKAIQHKRRISEKSLLLQTIIFGGIGAFLGGRLFRHKINKWYFKFCLAFRDCYRCRSFIPYPNEAFGLTNP